MIDASISPLVQHIQHLHDLDLEEGKAYIQAHISELQDHLTVGELLAQEALDKIYSPLLSLKLAELLIFFGDCKKHKHSYALGLKAKGDALVQIGHYQAAMEYLDAAGEEFLRLGEDGDWARSRISWITACAWLDNVERALQEAELARRVFEQSGEHFWTCVLNNNVAVIFYYVGRYQDAITLYDQMREIYSTLVIQDTEVINRHVAIADMNEALCFSYLGNFARAYLLYQQAQKCFSQMKDIDLLIASEVNLAELDYVQGYYGSALRRYYRAHDNLIEHSTASPVLLADIRLCIANCLIRLRRIHEARILTTKIVEMEQFANVSLDTLLAFREHASVLVASGDRIQSLAFLKKSLSICNKLGLSQQGKIIELHIAELLLLMGSTQEAYKEATVLVKYFEPGKLPAYSARAILVMVEVLLEQSQYGDVEHNRLLDEGIILCKQTIAQAHQYNLHDIVYRGYHLLGRVSRFKQDISEATHYYRMAIARIERILEDLSYDLSPAFLLDTWTVYADTILFYLAQSRIEQAFSILERARSMALRQYLSSSSSSHQQKTSEEQQQLVRNSATMLKLQQELRDWQERYREYSTLLTQFDTTEASTLPDVKREIIQNELKRCESKLSELFERLSLYQDEPRVVEGHSKRHHRRTSNQFDVGLLRKQLGSNQALLAYFLHEGRLVIFVATNEKLMAHEIPDGAEQLERLLPLLHARLLTNSQSPQSIHLVQGLLRKLYNLLIDPIISQLPASGSLTIVPYGPLHKLPFHALFDGSHHLIESFQISYLPTSHLLLKTESNHDVTVERATKKQALIFGYSGQGHLPHALDEAKMLATLLSGNCYLEEEATIERLLHEAEDSPLIHLATHGHSRLDSPNFSSVLLADGQLNAIDAFGMNLSQCELVTLSGCETGLSLSGGGDEQLGLGRAFLAAGAKSLVISLWPVEDAATSELMQHFYQHLLQGESRIAALRHAQCVLLRSSSHAHPYFWAAFRLVGETGPISW